MVFLGKAQIRKPLHDCSEPLEVIRELSHQLLAHLLLLRINQTVPCFEQHNIVEFLPECQTAVRELPGLHRPLRERPTLTITLTSLLDALRFRRTFFVERIVPDGRRLIWVTREHHVFAAHRPHTTNITTLGAKGFIHLVLDLPQHLATDHAEFV